MVNSDLKLIDVRPKPFWYHKCETETQMIEKLKKLSKDLDPTDPNVLKALGNELTKEQRPITARRTLYVMKIVVLRAHGISVI